MSFRERLSAAWRAFRNEQELGGLYGEEAERLLEWLGVDRENKKAISEVTYYTCLKVLAETIGKMPLKYYQMTEEGRIRAAPDKTTELLTVRPNPVMTPTSMMTTLEMNTQHYGNGYLWLRRVFYRSRYGGLYKLLDIWPMQSDCVRVYMDDMGVFAEKGKMYYEYTDPRTGQQYVFRSEDVVHIKTWFSFDGIMGCPVRDILKYNVEGANAAQEVLNNQYKNGLSAAMAMQYVGDLDKTKRNQLSKKFADALSGPKNAGRVVPVPIGLTLQPLNVSMADAQFAELRKYSALQIAGAFGIKPAQLNDYTKSSYSSQEQQSLDFLVNTMLPRIKAYEEEINAKILEPEKAAQHYFYKFNEKVILRTDAKTQMETLKDGVNNGIYRPNEARDYLDLPSDPDGNKLIVNGNYIPLSMVGQQDAGNTQKGGEDGTD